MFSAKPLEHIFGGHWDLTRDATSDVYKCGEKWAPLLFDNDVEYADRPRCGWIWQRGTNELV